MSSDPTHSNLYMHRDAVPDDQLATGTPTTGMVPVWTGENAREWQTPSGGGGDCEHEHRRERFVAVGGSPETFTLADPPIDGTPVDVFQGSPTPLSMVDPDDVTVTGSDVALDTTTDDVVVIAYERGCAPGPLATLTEVQAGDGSHDQIYALIIEGWTGGTYALRYHDIDSLPDDYTVSGIPPTADASDLQGALAAGSYPSAPDPGNWFAVSGTGVTGDPFLIEFYNPAQYGLSPAILELTSSLT